MTNKIFNEPKNVHKRNERLMLAKDIQYNVKYLIKYNTKDL